MAIQVEVHILDPTESQVHTLDKEIQTMTNLSIDDEALTRHERLVFFWPTTFALSPLCLCRMTTWSNYAPPFVDLSMLLFKQRDLLCLRMELWPSVSPHFGIRVYSMFFQAQGV